MESIGLIILAVVQLITAIIILIWPRQSESFGLQALINQLSIYRYLLASLWLSVTMLYFAGAFINEFTKSALLLGVINITFEIISYWAGFKNITKTRTFPNWGTLVMGVPGVICFYELLNY